MSRQWKDLYAGKRTTLDNALRAVKRGSRVFLGTACGEPGYLVQGLMDRSDRLHDVQLIHFVTLGDATYTEARFDNRFRHNAFFVGPKTREAINQARADYTPIFISEIPELLRKGTVPIDVALIQTSLPDRHGFVSLGISVDIVKAAVESAKVVIAQVNLFMPRTLGDTVVSLDRIHHIVEKDEPLLEFHYPDPDPVGRSIARNTAKLINDGDTLHIGYGHIPYAVLGCIGDRKHLGLHTEVISDAFIDLIEEGVFTGERKSLYPGKAICSFCIGTRRIYDYVRDNPRIAFHPAEVVYNPLTIARNEHMVSIGSALEVDLSGQICSESKGHHFYSGIGGRLDFIRGAAMSEGGKSIITLPSSTKDGERSRIVADLQEGAGVVATRGDVKYVVTEYGIAYLHGKSVRERAMALINIAHPKFRGALLEDAKNRAYIYPDQIFIHTESHAYPEEEETTVTLQNGKVVTIRPIKPTDEVMLQEFFYSHSEETIYLRYFRTVQSMPHATAQTMVNLDYRNRMAFVATLGEIGLERIIGVGRYAVEKEHSDMVEVAYTTHEDFRGLGLGSLLQQHVERYAGRMGFRGAVGYLFEENLPMLKTFARKGQYQAEIEEDGILRVWRYFEKENQMDPEKAGLDL